MSSDEEAARGDSEVDVPDSLVDQDPPDMTSDPVDSDGCGDYDAEDRHVENQRKLAWYSLRASRLSVVKLLHHAQDELSQRRGWCNSVSRY